MTGIEMYHMIIDNCNALVDDYITEYSNVTCAQDCDLCEYSRDDYSACMKVYWLDRVGEQIEIRKQAEKAVDAIIAGKQVVE